jgi:2-polyprenyl-3-methyl-5-hydroxy-6-metoxy-1,4-benzoquinol methylase
MAVTTNAPADTLPTRQELESMFMRKHGSADTVGWAPRRRFRFGYYLPADMYEAVVSRLVFEGCTWIDVGGGHAIFPDNAGLANELVARCARVVAVDPSENVHQNRFVHERAQSTLEEYRPGAQFDLATLRMVVEHVGSPERFVAALAGLVNPGGTVVVLTVNRRAPISLLSWLLPFRLHHPIKRLFWGGEEKDTFPVHYRMNTRADLRCLFEQAGFEERLFAKLDDLSAFGRFEWLNYLELLAWSVLRRLGLGYPENCLLGVYRRHGEVTEGTEA